MRTRYTSPGDRRALVDLLRLLLGPFRAIGSDPDRQLEWLHAFSARDLSRPDARVSATAEVNAFLVVRYEAWGADIDTARLMDQPVEADEIEAIQHAVRDLVTQITPGSPAGLPTGVADGLLWRADQGVSVVTRARGVPQVLACVVEILTRNGAGLRRCVGCTRLYVKHRSDQRFCSTSCGTRFRVRDWREKNATSHRKNRHKQYVRKVQTRIPKARVTRRPKKGE